MDQEIGEEIRKKEHNVTSDEDSSCASENNDSDNSVHTPVSKANKRCLIRKRPVSFGVSRNCHGIVYTTSSLSSSEQNNPQYGTEDCKSTDVSCAEYPSGRLVAMIGVKPEHVPEGILNLIRSHRPFVEHVRVVISEEEPRNDDRLESHNDDPWGGQGSPHSTDRTYLVLVQLVCEQDATSFVEDLDGKPYIAFDDRDKCHIERVVHLETLVTPSFKASSASEAASPYKDPPWNEKLVEKDETDIDHTKSDHNDNRSLLPNTSEAGSYTRDKTPASTSTNTTATTTLNTKIKAKHDCVVSLSSMIMISNDSDRNNCAVCLEDLERPDDDGTKNHQDALRHKPPSLLTTVCNHTFHLDCLQRCTGPCPVCRYDHAGLNETLSQCHVCGTTEHNYVCLICGVVSCSVPLAAEASTAAASSESTTSNTTPRFYTSSHASQHYRETLHAYALDTQSQHVYDFCGQGYVHRLVQNKEDGKLVEIHNHNDYQFRETGRSLRPGLSDAQEGEVVHRKLEGAAERYNSLLKSQLEQQRSYYEQRLLELKAQFEKERQEKQNHRCSKDDLLTLLQKEKKQVHQRLGTLQRKTSKVLEDASFLKNMNESLQANQPLLKHRIQQAGRERNESQEIVSRYLPKLEEKLSTLMQQLEESL